MALVEPERFDLQTRDRPAPGPEEVLVRVDRVGICGSDLHYFRDGRNGENELDAPTVLGHEAAGTVVERGSEVADVAVEDRVAIDPSLPCGDCPHCRRGESNLCSRMAFMGSPPVDGALAEFVARPADAVHVLPPSVPTRAGALCEPLGVAVHATRRAGVDGGDAVLVTGCGPIGLLVADAARAAGASRVFAADVVPAKRSLAADRGADRTIDPREESLPAAVQAATDGLGADVVLECSGAEAAIAEAAAAARRGGRIGFVGLPQDPSLPFDLFDLIDDELDVSGSFRFRGTFPRAIELLEAGRVDAASLVDFEASLEDAAAAFRRASDPEVVKGMIALDR
jgi:L-iditol 2-dehydrogenase